MGETDNLSRTIAVLGATGYVGSRLVPMLLALGYRVRACSRSLDKLQVRDWSTHPNVELMQVDTLREQDCRNAVDGCTHILYLVHSMNPQHQDFARADRKSAHNIVAAADAAGVRQLIYLGGLGETDQNLSKHLRSRAEVGEILTTGKFKTTVLRAAMIIGSGSASFEILRYLVDRLPFMITPRWVSTPSQPIAIRNVLNYLIGCLDNEETFDQVFDIGGPEVVTYRQLMDLYAEEAGVLKPVVLPVPVFTPRLSSYWINFITPIPAYIARPLAEGLRNPAVCTESQIQNVVPQELLSCRRAIRLAIDKMQHHLVESHWTDAGAMPPVEWVNPADPDWAGGQLYTDTRELTIAGTASDAWQALSKIGGTTGWYYANWLWHLRGLADWLVGGVGLRVGRRHPNTLRVGDAVDFWRVRGLDHERRLLLIAEMKLPGQAALEFTVVPLSAHSTKIVQTAKFLPSGLLGLMYWYGVSPLHELIFSGMLKGIAAASKRKASQPRRVPVRPAT
ncbi:MAG: SDR family oxidoreductase [Candidatus Obscuribacterales bacterium]